MHRQSSIINHRLSMRSGYTLIEMLAVVAITPMLMILVGGFFRTFIRDLPQSVRLVQQNVTVLNWVDQLGRDMDRAVALPSQVGDRRADDATLLIGQPEGVVCYRLEEGRIVRTMFDPQGEAAPDGEHTWKVPDAAIQWRSWLRDGNAYAIEVQSHLKQRVNGEIRRRFRNSHVFFVGSLASGGEIQ